jgi:oxygen-independent coproporphyrinogen-3 oxidase
VNPESASWEKFDALRQSGINRLSLGIQSGQDSDLQHLGRIHDTLQSRQAVLSARKAGFDNLSVDLIAGLPGQSIPGWRDSLEFALELDPEHISVYLLEIHPDTPYGRAYGPGTDYPTDRHLWPPLPEEELLEKMYFHTLERLGKAGYLQYEISNFAKPGFQSRHNLRYWQGMSVLGFGCGAFSNHGNHRWGNVRDLSDYVSRIKAAKSTLAEKSVSSPPERIGELFFLGMRTLPGISTGEFQQKTGLDLGAIFSGPLHFLVEAGLVRWTEGLLGLTPRGCLLSNEVFAEFLRFLDSSV